MADDFVVEYWRHKSQYTEEFDTFEAAVAFGASGQEWETHAIDAIIRPDGTRVDGKELDKLVDDAWYANYMPGWRDGR